MADDLKLKANALKSGLKPIWCPGCGDFGVLASAYRAFAELDLDPDNTVIVSGIGCSSRFPGFVATYGFHGVHGRALPTAMGVKLANPDLNVIAVGGDGDGFAIGGGHFPHAARRNVDITYIIMNNQTYGLTKGQVSPTSLHDQKSPSTPFGNLEEPMNVLATAIAADCSYVAQGASFRAKELTELIVEGIRHPGFSFIDAFSPCTAFNNTTQEWKEAVEVLPAEHDSSSRPAAFAAALTDPMGIGIYYRSERPTLDGRVRAMQDASPAGSVEELIDGFSIVPREPRRGALGRRSVLFERVRGARDARDEAPLRGAAAVERLGDRLAVDARRHAVAQAVCARAHGRHLPVQGARLAGRHRADGPGVRERRIRVVRPLVHEPYRALRVGEPDRSRAAARSRPPSRPGSGSRASPCSGSRA